LNTDLKAATTHPKVHALIRSRWSPRAFSDKEVPAGDLAAILDAARWAASSYNEQPWRFIVATKQDPEAYQKLLGLLLPFNQAWAKTAPVLILMAAKKTFTHNHTPNKYALHDTGAALANLFLQATALGLHAHGMAGFDYDRARSELTRRLRNGGIRSARLCRIARSTARCTEKIGVGSQVAQAFKRNCLYHHLGVPFSALTIEATQAGS
jgi:hypothetical protein